MNEHNRVAKNNSSNRKVVRFEFSNRDMRRAHHAGSDMPLNHDKMSLGIFR